MNKKGKVCVLEQAIDDACLGIDVDVVERGPSRQTGHGSDLELRKAKKQIKN